MIEIHDSRIIRQPNDDEKPIIIVYVQDNMNHVTLGYGADIASAKEVATQRLFELVSEVTVAK